MSPTVCDILLKPVLRFQVENISLLKNIVEHDKIKFEIFTKLFFRQITRIFEKYYYYPFFYSVSLFELAAFLPRRLDSQNLKQSLGNFGCLAAWVKKGGIRKDSRRKYFC
jgi:hypothetical protein